MKPPRLTLANVLAVFTGGCLWVSAPACFAAPADLVAELQRLVAAQQRQIDALQLRLAALEQSPSVAAPTHAPSAAVPISPLSEPADRRSAAVTDLSSEVGRFPDAAIVRASHFPRAVIIPGTDLSLRLGGFAQVDASVDFGRIRSPAVFLASSIAEEPGRHSRTRLSARQTRLNVDVRGNTVKGESRVFVEGDFGGDGGEERLANGSTFRLRHAFGQIGRFYAGQYWSAFADVSAFPETLDPAAPAGKSVTRQTGVRYVHPLESFGTWSLALENPSSDLTGAVARRESMPDLLLVLRRENTRGHLQVAGLLRRFVGAAATGREADAVGYGVNITGHLGLATGGGRDRLSAGLVHGEGVGRYLAELAGLGLDATLEEARFELAPTRATGAYLSGQHWWTPQWRSTVAVGVVEASTEGGDPSVTFERSTTLLGNLLWNPVAPLTLGLEAIWGQRAERDGNRHDALRILSTARLAF